MESRSSEVMTTKQKSAEVVWWIILVTLAGTILFKTFYTRQLDFITLTILLAFAPQPFKERGAFKHNKITLFIMTGLAVISLGLAFAGVNLTF
jgi:hypothetical protein